MKAAHFIALTVLQAHAIREHYEMYSRAGDSDEVHMEDLKDVIAAYVGIRIEISQVNWAAQRFLGTLQRFHDVAKIFVPPRGARGEEGKLTLCEQRFIVAKEMGHLVIDQPDNYTRYAAALVEELCNPMLAELDSRQQLQSEYVSQIFAIETLFPYPRRKPHLESIRRKEATPLEVATHFRIPEKQVQAALRPGYEQACEHIYKFLLSPGPHNE